MTKKILGFVKTEIVQAIGFVLVAILIFWAVGCESMVTSLTDPVKKVTRSQLSAEIAAFNAEIEATLKKFAANAGAAYDALDKQDAFRQTVFNHLALYAQTGALNPAGVVAAIVSILGVAAVADNVKKRVEIKTIKKKNGDTT